MTHVARARRWDHGWEIYVDGVGVTQVRILEHAKRQACDLIETMTDERPGEEDVEVRLDMGDFDERAAAAREMTARAAEAQREAAVATRQVVADLRREGLSVSDIATILGVTRGRVSQLAAGAPTSDSAFEPLLADLAAVRSRGASGPESVRELIDEGRR